MDSYDSSIDEMTKMLFQNMKIGIMLSDEMILQIAGSIFDESEDDYETKKLSFLNNIHKILGK